jgi:hypothetical protein
VRIRLRDRRSPPHNHRPPPRRSAAGRPAPRCPARECARALRKVFPADRLAVGRRDEVPRGRERRRGRGWPGADAVQGSLQGRVGHGCRPAVRRPGLPAASGPRYIQLDITLAQAGFGASGRNGPAMGFAQAAACVADETQPSRPAIVR